MTRAEAIAIKNGILKLREGAGDALASTAPGIYPTLKGDGSLIRAGERINHGGRLLRATVDLWDSPESDPEVAPNLWEEINYREGYRIIPEVITAASAFALGELGWWEDELYRSMLSANVYTPSAYPSGWKKEEAK